MTLQIIRELMYLFDTAKTVGGVFELMRDLGDDIPTSIEAWEAYIERWDKAPF